jgi:hypothetical protein
MASQQRVRKKPGNLFAGKTMKRSTFINISRFSCAALICLFLDFTCATLLASMDLTILSQDSNGVTVAWPDKGSYSLQTNSSPFAPNWGVYGGPVSSTNGTNSATIQPLDASEFFRLEEPGADTLNSPTNISGMAYYWNYNDLPASGQVNSWTDEVQSLVMTYNQGGNNNHVAPATTGIFPGLNIPDFGDYIAFTNNLSSFGSNFTLWVVMRPSIEPDSTNEAIFGDGDLHGLNISTNTLSSDWGDGIHYSSMQLNYAYPGNYPYGETYDILDSGGILYSNGVMMSAGLGQPTNNFPFAAIGAANQDNGYSAEGYIQYIGVWTNLLTATDATNLDYWYWNCGVTNVTNGLIAWWKLNDGSGTIAADSCGTNTMYFGGTGNMWTNTGVGFSTSLYFNGSGWMTNISTNFAGNLNAITVTAWTRETSLADGADDPNAGAIITYGYNAHPNPGWYVSGDNPSDIMFGVSDVSGTYKESPHSPSGNFPVIGDNTWHFLAAEYTNNPATGGIVPYLYIDGCQITGSIEADGQTVTNISSPADGLNIGGWTGFGSNPAGIISDVRIYNRELSVQEINDLYKWRGEP